MATFLRDQRITNVTIDEDAIRSLDSVLRARADAHHPELHPLLQSGQAELITRTTLSYTIRFDNKGYRVTTLEKLLEYFRLAKMVERLVGTVDTEQSRTSNRSVGSFLEVSLDIFDFNRCLVIVTSEDGDWVDASISSLQDVIVKRRNRNGWVRTVWAQLALQLIGVALGFILSLWAASKIAPKLTIENPFMLSVLFVLLVFSNIWTFANQRVLLLMNTLFPNVYFRREKKDRLHWLWQTMVGAGLFAIAVYVIGWILHGIGAILDGFIRP